jgi:hypothetical protein
MTTIIGRRPTLQWKYFTCNTCTCCLTRVKTLTIWSWALPDNPPVGQILKNFLTFYGTRRFIIVFTGALHWSLSWVRSTQSIWGGLISLWIYKENKLRHWKNVFTLNIPFSAPHAYDLVVLTYLTHPRKILLCAANRKSRRLIRTPYVPPHPTALRPILILSTHLHFGLPCGLFPSGFPTKILYALLPHSCYGLTLAFKIYFVTNSRIFRAIRSFLWVTVTADVAFRGIQS